MDLFSEDSLLSEDACSRSSNDDDASRARGVVRSPVAMDPAIVSGLANGSILVDESGAEDDL